MIPPRFPVTPAQIDRIVGRFYAAVRKDCVLGPVFAARVGDWAEHEAKIAAFWRNAILRERGYDGNPMRRHVQTPQVLPQHFPIWLELFDHTLAQELPPEIAQAWSALAHKIGEGMRMGVDHARPKEGPPILR